MKAIRQSLMTILTAVFMVIGIASIARAQLPNPGMEIDPERTAIVITDPQNDFLSPDGVTWAMVGKSVTENNTVANIEALLKVAKANNLPVSSRRAIIIQRTTAGNSKAPWKKQCTTWVCSTAKMH